jgi:uncharacterized membrane protein YbhN (UPF0104 family)
LFTPLQSGELLKVELMKKYGFIDRSPGYGSFLVERALDLAIVLLMGCVTALTSLNILRNKAYAWGAIGVIIGAAICGLVVLQRLKFVGRARVLIHHMRGSVGGAGGLALIIAVSVLSWVSVAASWEVLLAAAHIYISPLQAIAIMSVVALISVLSLIPGGIGISEAGSSQVLMQFGFPMTIAQSGAVVLRSYSVIAIVLGLSHLGVWARVRQRRARRASQTYATAPPTSHRFVE